jgi:hypothetical protein
MDMSRQSRRSCRLGKAENDPAQTAFPGLTMMNFQPGA